MEEKTCNLCGLVDIILKPELSEHSMQRRFMKRNTDMKQVSQQTSPGRWLLVLGLGVAAVVLLVFLGFGEGFAQIGRASCRERV